MEIVRIRFGSHLYGTSTPASDIDLKAVHVPPARDILLARAKGSISTKRPKALGEKNYAGEADEESYSLAKFLDLVAEGQTVALDVLFAPRSAMLTEPQPLWLELLANKGRLLTSKSASFVGYCRQQANKYGIKGSRVAAARAVLASLKRGMEQSGPFAKLGQMAAECSALAAREHIGLTDIPCVSGDASVRHLEVCGRKLPFTSSIKNAHDIVERLVAEYGHRALQAEANEGVDWKALSHAVRIGHQAIELLQTGAIHFPLEYAPHLLDIKLGKLPYAAVATEIEELLEAVEAASASSSLPDEVDREWIDDFVAEVYAQQVESRVRMRPYLAEAA